MKMGHGTVSEELNILLLCKQMKWTYTEYMEQPQWFVESMAGLLRTDIKEENRRVKKSQQKHGR